MCTMYALSFPAMVYMYVWPQGNEEQVLDSPCACQALRDYQSATAGTRCYPLSLIEPLARAYYQIAVLL